MTKLIPTINCCTNKRDTIFTEIKATTNFIDKRKWNMEQTYQFSNPCCGCFTLSQYDTCLIIALVHLKDTPDMI